MRRECARLGIGKIYCSLYYPQGNSIHERFHGFLKHTISTFVVSLTDMTMLEIITNALLIYIDQYLTQILKRHHFIC